MVQPTSTVPRKFGHSGDPHELATPVLTGVVIHKGAYVGKTAAGFARQLEAGDEFAGVCVLGVDNTDGASGDCDVRTHGRVRMRLDVTGASVATNGDAVFASDGNTFTLTSTANSKIGAQEISIDGTDCWVNVIADSLRNAV